MDFANLALILGQDVQIMPGNTGGNHGWRDM